MKIFNKTTIIVSAGTLIIGLFFGWLIFSEPATQKQDEMGLSVIEETTWTCSMHPSIRQQEPGKCPICGMDLIPLRQDDEQGSPLEVKMSAQAIKLANIQTATAEIQAAQKEVRLTGKVQTDETRIFSQTSHIGGRIESLKVNFTGEYVKNGQILASVYSPELVTAQKELFEAYKIKESQPGLYQAARDKLINWKLTNNQIDAILREGVVKEQIAIRSDVSGVVMQRSVSVGDYIKKGDVLYEIADLSKLWILFEVYESDLPWVKVGSMVSYTVQSIPGSTFEGKISFIDPVINPATRVAKARISVSNKNLELKPEMFVVGRVTTVINESALTVPRSAVMWTGTRSIIYIKHESAAGISFALREITLGEALGDRYIVKEGLEAGEEFVVNGAFSVDAAAQLAGKRSMMNPDGATATSGHDHGSMPSSTANTEPAHNDIPANLEISEEAGNQLSSLVGAYIALKNALVEDNFAKVKETANQYWQAYEAIDMASFTGEAHDFWMKQGMPIKALALEIKEAASLEEARGPFKPFSNHMVSLAKGFKTSDKTIFVQYCPMADDFKGASWLSYEDNIYNPYFGAAMLTCGEVTDTINSRE